MSMLATFCLKDFSFAQERMYSKTSLFAFSPFLEDHLMLSFSKTFGKYDERVFSSDHEYLVGLR